MSARKMYTAAEALRVDQLRAEARAWRRAAVAIDADAPGVFGLLSAVWLVAPTTDVRQSMRARGRLHSQASNESALDSFAMTWDALVLACLLLALECEGEARALGRGAR